jgi:hypothetical protein
VAVCVLKLFVENPQFAATRAVTMRAAPEQVWPWLVQMGFGRAGMYSYEWLDNHRKPNASEILPEFQHMAVRDVVPEYRQESRGRQLPISVWESRAMTAVSTLCCVSVRCFGNRPSHHDVLTRTD